MESAIDKYKIESEVVKKTQRKYSIDILKFLASIAVVLIHITSNYRPYEFMPNTGIWDVELGIYYLSKWSVPVFVMCSGYFLLNDKQELSYNEFIKKRLSKILIPFIAISMIFTLYYQNIGGNIDIKWAIVGLVKNILGYPASAHLWFLYPLIGVYLLTPLFKGLIEKIDVRIVISLSLILILAKTIAPFTDLITQDQYNYWRDVPLATNAFAIYFILGGYLGRVELKTIHKVVIYISTIVVGIIGFFAIYKLDILYNRNLEVLLDISSINNLLISISVFIFFKDIKKINNIKNRFIKFIFSTLSEINFGVFLFHPLFIDILKSYSNYTGNIIIDIFKQLLMVYATTGLFVFIIKRIPLLKKIA